MACNMETTTENIMFSYDPAGAQGAGSCTRSFETVMTNSLSTGTVVGTPSRVSGTDASTKDICCMQGNTSMDAGLLMACNQETTQENIMYTYDPAASNNEGLCTITFDIVMTNKLSTGAVIGTPTSSPRTGSSHKDDCCTTGNTLTDTVLLMACNMEETIENRVYAYDPSGGPQGTGQCT